MSGAKNRRDRLGGQVRAVIAQCLLKEVKDPRLKSVDVTDVVVSPDLGHAKVYYYARGDEADLQTISEGLDRARGFLRRRVGQEIRARITPDLAFYYDDSIERGAYIEELLNQVKERDEAFAVAHRGGKSRLSESPEGSTAEGSTAEGSTAEGSTAEGSTAEGSTC